MSSTTEELYPFMVPDDEEGYLWHTEYMTKEEIVATLQANNEIYDNASIALIENNQQYVTEFALDVKPGTLWNDSAFFAASITVGIVFVLFLVFEILRD